MFHVEYNGLLCAKDLAPLAVNKPIRVYQLMIATWSPCSALRLSLGLLLDLLLWLSQKHPSRLQQGQYLILSTCYILQIKTHDLGKTEPAALGFVILRHQKANKKGLRLFVLDLFYAAQQAQRTLAVCTAS